MHLIKILYKRYFEFFDKLVDCEQYKGILYSTFLQTNFGICTMETIQRRTTYTLFSNGRIDEAWDLLLQESKRDIPPEATLHLFIRTCRKNNEYDKIWKIIGEFQRRWKVWPHSKGTAMLFKFACEKEQFSDATLIWEFAQLQRDLVAIG